MDANRPTLPEEIVKVITQAKRDISPTEFYILCTNVELDPEYLEGVLAALDTDLARQDIPAIQTMVDEISRQEKRPECRICDKTRELLGRVFEKLDDLNVDYRRLVFERVDNFVHLAGDF